MNQQIGLISGLACFLACLLLIITRHWHASFTSDQSVGVQRFHETPTPRVGGVGLFLGLLVAWCQFRLSPVGDIMWPIVIAGSFCLVIGLAEDITKKVSILLRLSFCAAGGLLIWILTGVGVNRTDIWFMDVILTHSVFVGVFTAFALAGICNATNMIDGCNGIASGVGIISLLTIAIIGNAVDDSQTVLMSIVLASIIFGFFLLNFPFGRIFLGDAGAYLVGFFVGWTSILLVSRNDSVTPLVVLLISFPSLVEVLLSVVRRILSGSNPLNADAKHYHTLIMLKVSPILLPKASQLYRNSATFVMFSPTAILAAWLATETYDNAKNSIFALMGMLLLQVLLYTTLLYMRPKQ